MKILITGGCGFIGCHVTQRLRASGHEVTVLDNLSRATSTHNKAWLEAQGRLQFVRADVRDRPAVEDVVRRGRFDAVVHLAAQVAVTTSVFDPRDDFEVNALGTFNVLEAVRQFAPEAIVLNASTNKVYGKLKEVRVRDDGTRYVFVDLPRGVDESQPLDFHSPYGCSKGAGDQYVVDYARIYGLRTVNFRQSCIYGTRQFGIEDQGWVAWFVIAHLLGRPLTLYGDGKQLRDVLYVDDLVDCYFRAIERIDTCGGMSFNIGGGPANTLSLLECIRFLESLSGCPVSYRHADWRTGDQRVFVADTRKAQAVLGWTPNVDVRSGIRRLYDWVAEHLDVISGVLTSP